MASRERPSLSSSVAAHCGMGPGVLISRLCSEYDIRPAHLALARILNGTDAADAELDLAAIEAVAQCASLLDVVLSVVASLVVDRQTDDGENSMLHKQEATRVPVLDLAVRVLIPLMSVQRHPLGATTVSLAGSRGSGAWDACRRLQDTAIRIGVACVNFDPVDIEGRSMQSVGHLLRDACLLSLAQARDAPMHPEEIQHGGGNRTNRGVDVIAAIHFYGELLSSGGTQRQSQTGDRVPSCADFIEYDTLFNSMMNCLASPQRIVRLSCTARLVGPLLDTGITSGVAVSKRIECLSRVYDAAVSIASMDPQRGVNDAVSLLCVGLPYFLPKAPRVPTATNGSDNNKKSLKKTALSQAKNRKQRDLTDKVADAYGTQQGDHAAAQARQTLAEAAHRDACAAASAVDIRLRTELWALVIHAMASEDALARKRGMLILSRAVDLTGADMSWRSLPARGDAVGSPFKWPADASALTTWVADWTHYQLIFEVVADQNQFHLFEQLLPHLKMIVTRGGASGLIDPNWASLLLYRGLENDAPKIRHACLGVIVGVDVSSPGSGAGVGKWVPGAVAATRLPQEFVSGPFLRALKELSVFNSHRRFGMQLVRFLLEYSASLEDSSKDVSCAAVAASTTTAARVCRDAGLRFWRPYAEAARQTPDQPIAGDAVPLAQSSTRRCRFVRAVLHAVASETCDGVSLLYRTRFLADHPPLPAFGAHELEISRHLVEMSSTTTHTGIRCAVNANLMAGVARLVFVNADDLSDGQLKLSSFVATHAGVLKDQSDAVGIEPATFADLARVLAWIPLTECGMPGSPEWRDVRTRLLVLGRAPLEEGEWAWALLTRLIEVYIAGGVDGEASSAAAWSLQASRIARMLGLLAGTTEHTETGDRKNAAAHTPSAHCEGMHLREMERALHALAPLFDILERMYSHPYLANEKKMRAICLLTALKESLCVPKVWVHPTSFVGDSTPFMQSATLSDICASLDSVRPTAALRALLQLMGQRWALVSDEVCAYASRELLRPSNELEVSDDGECVDEAVVTAMSDGVAAMFALGWLSLSGAARGAPVHAARGLLQAALARMRPREERNDTRGYAMGVFGCLRCVHSALTLCRLLGKTDTGLSRAELAETLSLLLSANVHRKAAAAVEAEGSKGGFFSRFLLAKWEAILSAYGALVAFGDGDEDVDWLRALHDTAHAVVSSAADALESANALSVFPILASARIAQRHCLRPVIFPEAYANAHDGVSAVAAALSSGWRAVFEYRKDRCHTGAIAAFCVFAFSAYNMSCTALASVLRDVFHRILDMGNTRLGAVSPMAALVADFWSMPYSPALEGASPANRPGALDPLASAQLFSKEITKLTLFGPARQKIHSQAQDYAVHARVALGRTAELDDEDEQNRDGDDSRGNASRSRPPRPVFGLIGDEDKSVRAHGARILLSLSAPDDAEEFACYGVAGGDIASLCRQRRAFARTLFAEYVKRDVKMTLKYDSVSIHDKEAVDIRTDGKVDMSMAVLGEGATDGRILHQAPTYFNNTWKHRKKLRTWQSAYILSRAFEDEAYLSATAPEGATLEATFRSVVNASYRPNLTPVGYYVEWILARLALLRPSLVSIIDDALNTPNLRTNAYCTMLKVVAHIARNVGAGFCAGMRPQQSAARDSPLLEASDAQPAPAFAPSFGAARDKFAVTWLRMTPLDPRSMGASARDADMLRAWCDVLCRFPEDAIPLASTSFYVVRVFAIGAMRDCVDARCILSRALEARARTAAPNSADDYVAAAATDIASRLRLGSIYSDTLVLRLLDRVLTDESVCAYIRKIDEDGFAGRLRVSVDSTFQGIFETMPATCDMQHDELVPPEAIASSCASASPAADHATTLFGMPLNDRADSTCWEAVPVSGASSGGASSVAGMDGDMSESKQSTSVQRKIQPPDSLVDYPDKTVEVAAGAVAVDSGAGQSVVGFRAIASRALATSGLDDTPSLIVVASLVDKVTNLGGLCRTCEIFRASLLVVPDAAILSDTEFKALTVTADRWMPMEAVAPENLARYLADKRREGYALVGAEQTSDSIKLGSADCAFPSRTVLVLGGEREGIPVDLIQLLDACIEIPQFGIIRSLNVHVSGAILIWEYARQWRLDVGTDPHDG